MEFILNLKFSTIKGSSEIHDTKSDFEFYFSIYFEIVFSIKRFSLMFFLAY